VLVGRGAGGGEGVGGRLGLGKGGMKGWFSGGGVGIGGFGVSGLALFEWMRHEPFARDDVYMSSRRMFHSRPGVSPVGTLAGQAGLSRSLRAGHLVPC